VIGATGAFFLLSVDSVDWR